MIKNKSIYAIFLFLFLSLNKDAFGISALSKAKITVLDESSNPVEGADVGISFQYDKAWATGVISKDGITDEKGSFSASHIGNGYIGYGAEKNGYYPSSYKFEFQKIKENTWRPWNPELYIFMRKIGDPIPMYARKLRIEIPVANENIGFDLICLDWVPPYGRGVVADFIFNLDIIDNGGDDFEYNVKIKFSNSFDGIQMFKEELRQGSIFKLPRMAPEEGYNKGISIYLKGLKRGAKMSWEENNHYIFRIRSEKEDDKLKRAMYGKILSDIRLSSAKNKGGMPWIEFKYYLNPDYTRNLEFDSNKNLFGPLSPLEEVGIK